MNRSVRFLCGPVPVPLVPVLTGAGSRLPVGTTAFLKIKKFPGNRSWKPDFSSFYLRCPKIIISQSSSKAAVLTGSREPAPVRTGTAGTGTGPEPNRTEPNRTVAFMPNPRKAAVPTGSREPAPVRTGTGGTGTGPEPEPAGTGTGTGPDSRTTGLPVQIAGLPGYRPG